MNREHRASRHWTEVSDEERTDHERVEDRGAVCPVCEAHAPYRGLIALGDDIEAWRFDCPNGHTTMVEYTSGMGDEEHEEATAAATRDFSRLTAAAPEMLDALYSILNIQGPAEGGYLAEGLDVAWHFEKVRAAIAKAEGR